MLRQFVFNYFSGDIMISRRVYECTIIVNAALEDQDIDAVISKITSYIENNGGNIQEVNKWGRRRLGYPINKKFNGFYVNIVFDTMPGSVPILERFLILEDTILRHLTLLLPQKLREQRAKRALEEGRSVHSEQTEDSESKRSSDRSERGGGRGFSGSRDRKDFRGESRGGYRGEGRPDTRSTAKAEAQTESKPEAQAESKPETDENKTEE
jgi:small subunit ribosomal protein S6